VAFRNRGTLDERYFDVGRVDMIGLIWFLIAVGIQLALGLIVLLTWHRG